MNNENKPSVIAELTAALASMAERAAAAEAEAEQYKKSSGEWYQFFTSKRQGTERHAGRTPESPRSSGSKGRRTEPWQRQRKQ